MGFDDIAHLTFIFWVLEEVGYGVHSCVNQVIPNRSLENS